MQRRSRYRLPYGALILTTIVFGLALGFSVFAFWPRGGDSGQDGPTATAIAGLTTLATGSATTSAGAAASAPTTADPAPPTATNATTTTIPATPATAPTVIPPGAPSAVETTQSAPEAFDVERAMAHIAALAEGIGPREAGGPAEQAAADYVAARLREFGYDVEIDEFLLPDGRVSRNVHATKRGASPFALLFGAHLDTVASSPGANDNGSGVAVALELARDFRHADVTPTVEFVFFGTEEVIDNNADHHHYGSRHFVQNMTSLEASLLLGMVSIDMIAFGGELVVRTMGRGPRALADMLLDQAEREGSPAGYARDPGNTGWSDHEAFEDAGYPVAWLERRPDPTHHTAGDDYEHCNPDLVLSLGSLVRGFLAGLTEEDIASLQAAREGW